MVTPLSLPKFSIVTPSLNQGRFIQQCIDSVQAQDWPAIEHFVIDGGSTDSTLQVLENNRHVITSYISEPDKGAADAINKGFRQCTGDIIAWLNADDYYLDGAFEKAARAWYANPNASFWFGNGLRVNEDGLTKSIFNSSRVLFNYRALVEGLDYILQPATFINPRILEKTDLLDTNLRWSFDWDLWIRLAILANPIAIDELLAASREWGSTLTAGGGFKRAEELRQMAEKYSGKPITHGTLSYWLDTLTGVLRNNPEAFSADIDKKLQKLWFSVQFDMKKLKVNEAGMPVSSDYKTVSETITIADDDTNLIEKINGQQNGMKAMVIAVDLYPLIAGVSGGIVPWVKGVLQEMVLLYPTDRVLMFHRPGQPPIKLEGSNIQYVPLHEHPGLFYKDMTVYCKAAQVDVVIRTYPQEHHPEFPFEKQVFIIPDIQHEFFPEFFPSHVLAARRRAFAFALTCGGAIATMTQHSRSTIKENPWTNCRDVFLMPAALPQELRDRPSSNDLPQQVRIYDQYFYMPANLWPHKNHRRLFEAFRIALPNLPPKTGLVLTGSPEGYATVLQGYEDLPILHLGFVPHVQVAALFQEATALVYFSLFEGFGMPLLEAFHYGTPVLCSNVSSLPEVGGDAVLACDPTNVIEMARLMQRILNETNLRENLAEKTAARLAAYDWVNPAHELHSCLDRLIRPFPLYEDKPLLISIVMPTRNHGRFIEAAIKSVLEQSYPHVELIVMDGASTDNTVEILKKYGDRIQWKSEPDKGQTDAINKGMALAEGEILAYLNSDDVLLPGSLENVVSFFKKYPECDMVYGNADYIDVNGNVIGSYNTAEFSFQRLMEDCCICQPAAFWRRRIANRVGNFNVELQTAMDYEYWLRIANTGGIIYHTQDKLAQSRLHEDAKTLAMRGKIYQEIFEICNKQGGYVSYSYCKGLWAYRFYEAWTHGYLLRKILPGLHRIPALFHFTWIMSRLYSKQDAFKFFIRTLFIALERHSPRISSVIRRIWRRSITLRAKFM